MRSQRVRVATQLNYIWAVWRPIIGQVITRLSSSRYCWTGWKSAERKTKEEAARGIVFGLDKRKTQVERSCVQAERMSFLKEGCDRSFDDAEGKGSDKRERKLLLFVFRNVLSLLKKASKCLAIIFLYRVRRTGIIRWPQCILLWLRNQVEYLVISYYKQSNT